DLSAVLVLLLAPWWLGVEILRYIGLGLVALSVWLLWRRIRWLHNVYERGVEAEAELQCVDEDHDGETDFRHASYRYEHAERGYDYVVTGSDFFMPLATRYGKRILL